MNIGVVTKIEEKYMLVMANMGIEKIKPRNNAYVGMKIEYSRKDVYIGFNKLEIRYVVAVMVIISIILFPALLLVAKDSEDAYAVVSVDINPSLELYIDENNIVTGYHSFNDDAKKMLSKDIIELNIIEALQAVVISAQEHNYLSNDDFILLSLKINYQNSKDASLEDLVKGFAINNQEKYKFVYVNATKLEHKNKNISLGRQQLASASGLDISEAVEISVGGLILKAISTDVNDMRTFEIVMDDQGTGNTKILILEDANLDENQNDKVDNGKKELDTSKKNEGTGEVDEVVEATENTMENEVQATEKVTEDEVQATEKEKEAQAVEKAKDDEVKAAEKAKDDEAQAAEKAKDDEVKAAEKAKDDEVKAAEKATEDEVKDAEKATEDEIKETEKATEDKAQTTEKENEDQETEKATEDEVKDAEKATEDKAQTTEKENEDQDTEKATQDEVQDTEKAKEDEIQDTEKVKEDKVQDAEKVEEVKDKEKTKE